MSQIYNFDKLLSNHEYRGFHQGVKNKIDGLPHVIQLLSQLQGAAGKLLSGVAPLSNIGNQWQSQAGYALSQLNPVKPAYATSQGPSQFSQSELDANLAKHPIGPQYYSSPLVTGGGNGSGNVLSANTGPSATGQDLINRGVDNGNAQIESDYQNALSLLAGQEQGLRGQADTANQTIDQQFGAAKNEIQNTQATAEQAQNTNLSTAEKSATSATQQARDLFRQTQQQNVAQLSALGISSSSVAEALAERLGVETARRIAGVTGSLDEVRQNVTSELGRIKTYYQGKIADITNQSAIEKSNIQNALIQGLNNINAARGQAASDKANARANLLYQAQQAINGLAQQQQVFEQQLRAWAQQKSAALTPLSTNTGLQEVLTNFTNTINANPGITGSLNINANGQPTQQYTYSGQTSPSKTKKTTQNPEDIFTF